MFHDGGPQRLSFILFCPQFVIIRPLFSASAAYHDRAAAYHAQALRPSLLLALARCSPLLPLLGQVCGPDRFFADPRWPRAMLSRSKGNLLRLCMLARLQAAKEEQRIDSVTCRSKQAAPCRSRSWHGPAAASSRRRYSESLKIRPPWRASHIGFGYCCITAIMPVPSFGTRPSTSAPEGDARLS